MTNLIEQPFISVGGLCWSPELLSGPRGVANPTNGCNYYTQDNAEIEAKEQRLLVPTRKQYQQLFKRTTQKWIKRHWFDRWFRPERRTGVLFTDKENGNTVFFPALGFRSVLGSFLEVGRFSYYWSRSTSTNGSVIFVAKYPAPRKHLSGSFVADIQSANYVIDFPVRCLVP